VLSAVEKQRSKKAAQAPEEEILEDMSGELQTIPARHGVATFVPRGRTIKIINTYGKQVVSTWAFSLHAPPEQGEGDDEGLDAEEIEKQTEELKEEAKKEETSEQKSESIEEADRSEQKPEDSGASRESAEEQGDEAKKVAGETNEGADDPPEQAPPTPENEKASESTDGKKQAEKRTWASYLPSIPYRNRGAASNAKPSAESQKAEKAKNEAQSKAWSSYLPTGKGFSTYIPNVQIPDRESMISAFKQSHYRDPNKSYAEQLYDFSKTPVGAGTLAGKLFHCLMLLVSLLTLYSCKRFRHRIFPLRSLQCVFATVSKVFQSASDGVPLPAPHPSDDTSSGS
jgi:hypothetical protein